MSDEPRPLRQPGLVVYACGVATSLFAIWIVNLMQDHGENPMGWYANAIIPVGALIVGAVSGLGYALGSYFLNVKLSKSFIMFMLVTACLDYASMNFVTYVNLMESVHGDPARYSFIDWFRESTEGMTFKRSSSSDDGGALGMAGYFFRVLELVGFSLGVVAPCFVVFGKPYCRPCQKYLKPNLTRTLSSPVTIADWKKKPRKERPAFLETAVNELLARIQPLLDSFATLPLAEVRSSLEASGEPKTAKGTLGSVAFVVTKCPVCDTHHISAAMTNITNNKKPKTTTLASIDKPVPPPATAGQSGEVSSV